MPANPPEWAPDQRPDLCRGALPCGTRTPFHGRGHPYLVVRLSRQSNPAHAPISPRLPVDQILQAETSGLGPAYR
jgi:hypothetical protein